jgi:hypothetical protein
MREKSLAALDVTAQQRKCESAGLPVFVAIGCCAALSNLISNAN